ncbi:LppU family putative lipoprotein [Nocardia sp. IFM 10818]
MLRQQISARIAVPVISAVALLLAGCGTTVDGTAIASNDSAAVVSATTPSTTKSRPTTKAAPTTTNADKGGDTDFQATIGDCVKLGGTSEDATITKATCGSKESNYKVVAKARTNDQCPADVDQAYYETLAGVETGAICLDIDWVIGDCIDMGDRDTMPKRIECTSATAIDGVKVLEIVKNTTSVDDCTLGEQGRTYDERKFVVCVNTL